MLFAERGCLTKPTQKSAELDASRARKNACHEMTTMISVTKANLKDCIDHVWMTSWNGYKSTDRIQKVVSRKEKRNNPDETRQLGLPTHITRPYLFVSVLISRIRLSVHLTFGHYSYIQIIQTGLLHWSGFSKCAIHIIFKELRVCCHYIQNLFIFSLKSIC